MLKRLFSTTDFVKNTLTLTIGTLVAQSLPILIQPALRRLYSVEDYGAMSIYLLMFSLITIVSSLRYEANIVLPKNNIEAMNIVALTFVISLFFNSVIFLIICFFNAEIAEFLNLPVNYRDYLYLLPFATLAFAICQSINFWLIREKAFKASTYNKIARRGVEGAIQLSLGFFQKPAGLFAGDLSGNVANAAMGIKQMTINGFKRKSISIKKMMYVFKKYIDYPKYNVIPTLMSNAASVLPFFYINKFYSTELVGYIDLSRQVLSIPLVFVASALSQVLFQQISEKRNHNSSVIKYIKNVFYFIVLVILLESLVVMLYGQELFGFVFGQSYSISGAYSKILIFSFSLNFISTAFSSVFITFGKIKLNSVWQVAYFFLIAGLYFFRELDIMNFITIYVIMEVFIQAIYGLMIWNIINHYEKSIGGK